MSAGVWTRRRRSGSYPSGLRDLDDAPEVIYGVGDPRLLRPLSDPSAAVAIVGSRHPSAYGREIATRLGRELASAGFVVVSGMALGIDSCAHEGALEAGGMTVAVLGSGADYVHPPSGHGLYEQIVERGLVLSELAPGTPPRRDTFPARNRLMAALAAMAVVVEARRRSGSLITARRAADLGREVGAVPGRVGTSSADGTNSLLRDGAQVIRSGQDVLDSLLGPGVASLRPGGGADVALDDDQAAALAAIEGGAETLDAISREAVLPPRDAAVALTRLELAGLAAVEGGGRYRRTTEEV